MVGRTRGGRRCVGSGFVTVAGVLWERGVSPGTQGAGQQRGETEQREVEGGGGGAGAATQTCRDDPQMAAGMTTEV